MSFIEVILVAEAPELNEAYRHIVSEFNYGEWTRPEWIVMGDLQEEWKPLKTWTKMNELNGRIPVAVKVNPVWRGKWDVRAFLLAYLRDDYVMEDRFGFRAKFVEIEILDDPEGAIPPERPRKRQEIRTPQTKEERIRMYWSN